MANHSTNTKVVDCNRCGCRVGGKVLYERIWKDDDGDGHFNLAVLVCPSCELPLVTYGHGLAANDGWLEFSPVSRIWPEPESWAESGIPKPVRESLFEAWRCFKAHCFLGSAVMCGRTLESICAYFKTKGRTLTEGLDDLLNRGIVDHMILRWSHELRKLRNLAAHASGERVSKQDAEDMLDFTKAICDYVFSLNKKFRAFLKRSERRKLKRKPKLGGN